MLYRIDYQNYLGYMIDYFTLKELISIQYLIVSAKVKSTGTQSNVNHGSELYPLPEMIDAFVNSGDPAVLYKMYKDRLTDTRNLPKGMVTDMATTVYQCIVNPVLRHFDVCLICDKSENAYIDCIVKYVKETYKLDCIDLNQLFEKGKVGAIYIDRKEIHNKAVKFAKSAAIDQYKAYETSVEGRAYLLKIMSKRDKLKKLDELGITPGKHDDLDKLLHEAWVDD